MVVMGSCSDVEQELSSYWGGYDFSSVEDFQDIRKAEDQFSGYVGLLNRAPFEVSSASLCEFLDSAARNEVAYIIWTGWLEAYLHNTASPYRNDSLFRIWLDKVVEDKILDDYMMEHLLQVKAVADFNAVGCEPSDLGLMDTEGNEFRISGLKGRRTLVLFLDGGCKSCLSYLDEAYKDYRRKDIRLVAVLLNAYPAQLSKINSELPEDVRDRWTLAWCPGRELERGQGYDLTMIPSRILISPDGLVEKTYH